MKKSIIIVLTSILSIVITNIHAQVFVEQTGISLSEVAMSCVDWGDYDNDGDLDILLTGIDILSVPFSKVYRNDSLASNQGRTFTELTGINLTGVGFGSSTWGDYDNDGYLDILLTGGILGSGSVSKIYRNTPTASGQGRTFTEQVGIQLPGVGQRGSSAWGDYNNDGYLDIILSGKTNYPGTYTKIYQNVPDTLGYGRTFTELTGGAPLPGVYHGSVDWVDYDNDGDLDVLLTGRIGNIECISKIYQNDSATNGQGRTFTEQTGIYLTGVQFGSIAWGDYDNDGDLDILLTGDTSYISVCKLYRYDSHTNTFTEQVGASITAASGGSTAWGDYDNDGDLDILITGMSNSLVPISKIYRNDPDAYGQGRIFTEQTGISLPGVYQSSVAWADYDNDGDLDFILTGRVTNTINVSKIYQNNLITPNSISPINPVPSIMLYPNPNKGVFTLEVNSNTEKAKSFQLEIYNILGTLIYKKDIVLGNNLQKQMNFEGLSKGLYLIRLCNEDYVLNTRFIVE